MRSGRSVPATRLASAGANPPRCSRECAKAPTKRASSFGSAAPLHPAPAAVRRNQRPRIKPHQAFSQRRVGHFQRDAANILIAEEILTNELEVVEGAGVEEKGIAAPARKE